MKISPKQQYYMPIITTIVDIYIVVGQSNRIESNRTSMFDFNVVLILIVVLKLIVY